jgi:pSer/pThr/pTyr-binding forkhead associated (FHA) protein
MFIKVEVKSKDPVVYLIDQKELLIGSSPEICHLKIDHPSVSKKHLKILEEDGKFIAIDQGSTNGTYLKGEQIIPGKRVELLPEIKLRLGLYAFVSLVETADKFERIIQLDLNKPSSTKGGGSGENKTQLISMEDFKAAKALAQKKKIEAQKKKKAIESKKKRQDLKRILKAFLLVSVVLYVGYNGNSFFKTGANNLKKHSAVTKLQSKLTENQETVTDIMGFRVDRKSLIERDKFLKYIETVGCADPDHKIYCEGISPYSGVLKTENGVSVFIVDEGGWIMKAKEALKDTMTTNEELGKIIFLYILEKQDSETAFPAGDTFIAFYKMNDNGQKELTFVTAFNSGYTKDILSKFKKESLSSSAELNEMLTSIDPYINSY